MRFVVAVLGLTAALSAAAAPTNHDVFAIRYATIARFPVASLVQGAGQGRKLDIAMMVWLIRGGGHNVLVDSGFYRDDLMKRWKPVDFVRPDAAVARPGVKASDITDIIITHAHWDHAGGADLFPNATIWIQKDELRYSSTRAGKDGITTEDIRFLKQAQAARRLRLVAGDREILLRRAGPRSGRHDAFPARRGRRRADPMSVK